MDTRPLPSFRFSSFLRPPRAFLPAKSNSCFVETIEIVELFDNIGSHCAIFWPRVRFAPLPLSSVTWGSGRPSLPFSLFTAHTAPPSQHPVSQANSPVLGPFLLLLHRLETHRQHPIFELLPPTSTRPYWCLHLSLPLGLCCSLSPAPSHIRQHIVRMPETRMFESILPAPKDPGTGFRAGVLA
jgi:hypothetical protein